MSSSSSRKANSPASSSAATASRPRSSSASSAASSTPARSRPAACTRDPCTSSCQSRRSKPIEALIRANSGSCGWSKRATQSGRLEDPQHGEGALEQRVADQPGDHPVRAPARDTGEDVTDLVVVEPGTQGPGAELDPVGHPHELDLGAPVGLVSQRVVLRAGAADEERAPGALTPLDEDPLGELAALVRVHAAMRNRGVEPDV